MPETTTTTRPPATTEIDQQKIVEYLDTFGLSNELTDQEKRQFIEIAVAFQLNPFKRELYCIPFGEGEYRQLSIIVGYEVYLKRAERTGNLDGWRAYIEGTGEDARAIVEIHRKDWNHPFIHETFWKEAAQRKKDGNLTSFWRKMPRFQLKKVAISQAFRLAFPDELGGLPYDGAELPEEMSTPEPRNVTPATQDTDTPQKPANTKPEHPNPEPGKRNLDNTVPFPTRSPKPDTATGQTATRDTLEASIRQMLSSNGKVFPKAHVDWITMELKAHPTEERLTEILDHMKSVIGETDTAETEAPTPEPNEELIF
jgi:phage recombination protein Bet